MQQCSCRRKQYQIAGLLLVLVFGNFSLVSCTASPFIHNRIQLTPDSLEPRYLTTRRQAIVDYISALKSEDGFFHAYLRDPPPFDPAHLAPSALTVEDALNVMLITNTLGQFDLENTRQFISNLHNSDSNLPNSSKYSGPDVFTIYNALRIYPLLQLDSLISEPTMREYIQNCQTTNGGFVGVWGFTDPSLIETYFALESLHMINELNSVNLESAGRFVLDCLKNDGGFSNTPSSEGSIHYVVLGLKCLKMLDMTETINTTLHTQYLLDHWNSELHCSVDEHVLFTERIIWALSVLGSLDSINKNKTCDWILKLQKHDQGQFLERPDESLDNERLSWCESAVHVLEICNCLDSLDNNFSVINEPEWKEPDWWDDWVDENYGTSTENTNVPYVWNPPNLSFIIPMLPPLFIFILVQLPVLWFVYRKYKIRKLRRLEKRKRKKRRKAN